MNNQIADRLKALVCERLEVEPEEVTLDASLIADLGADSLAIVDLAVAFEEAFSLQIHASDYSQLLNIRDAIAYVEGHQRCEAAERGSAQSAVPSA